MIITAIAAVAQNRVIGKDNKLPWHLPADLRFFKKTTMGHHLIMGRKTWEALPNGPLPGRVNVVISRSEMKVPDGVFVFPGLEPALEWVFRQEETEVFIIGGAQIYASAMPMLDQILLTEVDTSPEGDAYFPEWRDSEWEEVSREAHESDDKNPFGYAFVLREKRKKRKEGHKAWRKFDY
ncbi:MAG: dihydrofolate reductase [Saprospiraceae bacterium]|nr:dihydrofolate reductase [Saprospiraceae bacterium]